MTDFDPAQRPSRASWKDGYRSQRYLEGQQAVRTRRDDLLREYRSAQLEGCTHGRVRKVGVNGGELWAGLECRTGQCGIVYLSAQEIFAQWRDTPPGLSPADDGA